MKTANMCEIKKCYEIQIFRSAMQDFFRAVKIIIADFKLKSGLHPDMTKSPGDEVGDTQHMHIPGSESNISGLEHCQK